MSQTTASARLAARPTPGRTPLVPLRVVPTAIQQSGNAVFAGLCMVLLGAGLVALLMLNTALAQGSFTLRSLQADSSKLGAREDQLTQVLDDLRSPRELADRAQQLGMVPARSMAFVNLRDGSILGVAAPAKAEQRLNVVTTPAAPPAPAPDPAAAADAAAPAPGQPATAAPR